MAAGDDPVLHRAPALDDEVFSVRVVGEDGDNRVEGEVDITAMMRDSPTEGGLSEASGVTQIEGKIN